MLISVRNNEEILSQGILYLKNKGLEVEIFGYVSADDWRYSWCHLANDWDGNYTFFYGGNNLITVSSNFICYPKKTIIILNFFKSFFVGGN